jgi:hypothetical protein
LARVDRAELEALGQLGFITALATGPLNIWAELGPSQALAAGVTTGIVQILGEAAAAADGRRRVVAAGLAL